MPQGSGSKAFPKSHRKMRGSFASVRVITQYQSSQWRASAVDCPAVHGSPYNLATQCKNKKRDGSVFEPSLFILL